MRTHTVVGHIQKEYLMAGSERLFERFGGKASERAIFDGVADLDGTAANFAILNVRLAANGSVEDHGYLFSAVRAHELVFHDARIRQVMAL
jgi:hypothetical protein